MNKKINYLIKINSNQIKQTLKNYFFINSISNLNPSSLFYLSRKINEFDLIEIKQIFKYINEMDEKKFNFKYILRVSFLIDEFIYSELFNDNQKYLISLKNDILHFYESNRGEESELDFNYNEKKSDFFISIIRKLKKIDEKIFLELLAK